jgi:signal transduction histidine kinase
MGRITKGSEPFKPYARLMNILGDQLITDKKVAVIEIVKNSYDADAENVRIRFNNLINHGKTKLDLNNIPYIEIEDDGSGMTIDIIRKVWLRPATPSKLEQKLSGKNITKRGRIIQGEKGVGRFAIHKLGEKIDLYTKALNKEEVHLTMDFREYNPENINLFNQPPADYKFLDSVTNDWSINNPATVIKKDKGTLIRIENLRDIWTENDLKQLYKSLKRLVSPVDENAKKLGVDFKQDFSIHMEVDGKPYHNEDVITFDDVIERAQYTMIGSVDENGILDFEYTSTTPQRSFSRIVNLLNEEALSKYNYNSYSIKNEFSEKKSPKCGSFKFTFYAFDLSKPDKMILNKDLMAFIKDNFVYVHRDGLRVYPYGEKGIDWLNLDKLRSTYRAGQFISYNDLTGFVYISQKENPLLKDSTNRQGIMDIEGAYGDFTALVTAITELFNAETKIDKGKTELRRKKSFKDTNEVMANAYKTLQKGLERIEDKVILESANRFFKTVENHTKNITERLRTVEDLAGLGMAVEKASHDGLALLSKMRGNVKDFIEKTKKESSDKDELLDFLAELDENLSFIYDEMQILQPLFKIQRKALKNISVTDSIVKVIRYFRRDIDNKINVVIQGRDDIIVKTNQGLVLQVIINLLDNAIFWVNKNETISKEIIFKIDSTNNFLYVADNGPGIREDVQAVIYNEFFSLKADGRGLGLYIVREILMRINAEILLIQNEKDKLLPGANFLIKFNQE